MFKILITFILLIVVSSTFAIGDHRDAFTKCIEDLYGSSTPPVVEPNLSNIPVGAQRNAAANAIAAANARFYNCYRQCEHNHGYATYPYYVWFNNYRDSVGNARGA